MAITGHLEDLEMHEELIVNKTMRAQRVPGGLLYHVYLYYGGLNDVNTGVTTTFVPFDRFNSSDSTEFMVHWVDGKKVKRV